MHAKNSLGIGFPIQIPTLHKSHQQRIAASDNGSRILTHTSVVKLTREDPDVPGSRVNGAIICENHLGHPLFIIKWRPSLLFWLLVVFKALLA